MLMCVPSQLTAQFLAKMVMPRSRSMALLSIDGVDDFFVFGECAGLAQQLVHHGGFAVVHVGDDGDVANLLYSYWSTSPRTTDSNCVAALCWPDSNQG
jgi:hypothetical protein